MITLIAIAAALILMILAILHVALGVRFHLAGR